MSKDDQIITNNPIDHLEEEYAHIECAENDNKESPVNKHDETKSTPPNLDSIRSAGL